jgi:hypothetical protein
MNTGISNADKLMSLQRHVAALQSGVTVTELGLVVEKHLYKLLDLSNPALQVVARHRILNSLGFEGMHQKFETVGNAAYQTFS